LQRLSTPRRGFVQEFRANELVRIRMNHSRAVNGSTFQ
jgi:hypothetical protein